MSDREKKFTKVFNWSPGAKPKYKGDPLYNPNESILKTGIPEKIQIQSRSYHSDE